jgi:hypothetical protein
MSIPEKFLSAKRLAEKILDKSLKPALKTLTGCVFEKTSIVSVLITPARAVA